jgi:SAM-dependent methyltransferase
VLVAQAWHWVDSAAAIPEVARVLRPGGRLGLLWNLRDDRVAWVAELSRILVQTDARSDAQRPGIEPPFGATERFDTPPWTQTLTPDGLVELAASRSYVITLDESRRGALLQRVRELAANHPELAGHTEIALPYITECVRAELPG